MTIMLGVMQASQEDVLACLRCLPSLRQLTAHLDLTPDTLVALSSLTALTELLVMAAYPTVSRDAICALRFARLWLPLHSARPVWTVPMSQMVPCNPQWSRYRAPAVLTLPHRKRSGMTEAMCPSHATAGTDCETCTCASGTVGMPHMLCWCHSSWLTLIGTPGHASATV